MNATNYKYETPFNWGGYAANAAYYDQDQLGSNGTIGAGHWGPFQQKPGWQTTDVNPTMITQLLAPSTTAFCFESEYPYNGSLKSQSYVWAPFDGLNNGGSALLPPALDLNQDQAVSDGGSNSQCGPIGGQNGPNCLVARHNGMINIMFCDGHAKDESFPELLTPTGATGYACQLTVHGC
jgi:prepilin-type processing-associated H-X9-DG protein